MKSELDASLDRDPLAQPLSTNRALGTALHLLAAFTAIVAVFWYIQSGSRGIVDPDGYYHIRWAWLLRETLPQGKLPAFVWLPLTILNEQAYVDHHFLFHVLQIPFTFTSDLVAGAKISAVFFGALAVLSCYALVVWARVPYPFAWLLALLACSAPFLFRMSLPRAPAVTVITLAIALWLLFTRRTIWLGVLSFLLVWMYSLFPLVTVLAGAWAVGVLLEERRIEWKPVAATVVGIVAGLIINPYFPRNLVLFAEHVGMKVAAEYEISVGNEWYPYESWYLLTSCAIAWLAQVAGWLATRFERREGLAREVCLLLFSTFLLVLTMKSRRFVEYWPPFAVLYAAFALRPYLERYKWPSIPAGWPRRIAAVVVLGLWVGVVFAIVANVRGTRASVAGEADPYIYRGAARWLAENTPEGSLVFNTDWDDFPMLFHHNTHNVYTSGLDPTYLLYANPELSQMYVDITVGRTPDPAHLIRDRFGARYAFTDSGHTDFIRNATTDGHMRVVYEDEHALVLEVADDQTPEDAAPADEEPAPGA
jgi:hypothetical protein